MADYSIKLGVVLDTKNIDTAINKYQGKPIKIKSQLDTAGITQKLSSYKAKPITVGIKLNPVGFAKQIRDYTPKTPVSLNVNLNTKSVDAQLKNYKARNIKLNFDLNFRGIAGKIIKYSKDIKPIRLKAELNKGAISSAINEFNRKLNSAESATRIRIKVEPDLKNLNKQIAAHQTSRPLKVNIDINKTYLNNQIKSFVPRSTIYLKASLKKGAIAQEIRSYKPSTPINVDLALNYADIDAKVGAYAAKGGVSIPAKLVPSTKGFTSGISKTPIPIQGKLVPEDINATINKFKPTAKIKIDARLEPKDINAQVAKLPKPTTPLNIGVKLDQSSINADIALFKPIATLGVRPDLILENVDEQISAYVPKVPIRVNVQVNNNDIDKNTGKQRIQEAIQVDAKLNRQGINEQIRSFKTNTKVKVDVKLNPKGIVEQIRKIEPKTKMRLGIELNPNDIAQQIGKINTATSIKLGVELDPSDIQNIKNQINNLRQGIQTVGNESVNLGVNRIINSGSGSSVRANTLQGIAEADIKIRDMENHIKNLKSALSQLGFNNASIDAITKDFRELGISVKNVTTSLKQDGSVVLSIKGLDQYERAVTLMKSIGKDGKPVDLGSSISQSFRETEVAFNRLRTILDRMKGLKVEIAGLDTSKNSGKISELTSQLNNLQAEYRELYSITGQNLSSTQFDTLKQKSIETAQAVRKVKAAMADTQSTKASGIQANFGKYNSQLLALEGRFNSLATKPPQLEAGLSGVRQALEALKTADGTDELIAANNRYLNSLRMVQTEVTQLKMAEKNANNVTNLQQQKEQLALRMSGWLRENSAAAKQFGGEIQNLQVQLKKCGNVSGVRQIGQQFKTITMQAKEAGLTGLSWGQRLKNQLSQYSTYLSGYMMFSYVFQGLRSMFEQVKAIDSAMTELKKVTNETNASYNQFLTNAASKAREIGTTIDGLVSSTADFARLGYNFTDAQGLAEVANIYAVVGDEVEGVEGATESLISTMAAYKSEMNGMSNSDFAMSIIDKFNEVGNNFAISSGGIGEAMERSASSLMAANNTIDESIALITAANTVVQNPEQVGKVMPTLKMAISVKILRRARPRKDFISIFNTH